MRAGNETTVESRILLSYWSPRSFKTVNGRKLNFFRGFLLNAVLRPKKTLELVHIFEALF